MGNVLFAATFLITDILSECEGKRAADKAVWIGVFSQVFFLRFAVEVLKAKIKRTSTDVLALERKTRFEPATLTLAR